MDKPRGEFGRVAAPAAGFKLAGLNAFASLEHHIRGRRLRIGSGAGNDLILAHQSVAARHAIIRNTRRGCYVRDLGSDTGTFLNGQRIAREAVVCPGDELRFGAARFVMVAGAGGFHFFDRALRWRGARSDSARDRRLPRREFRTQLGKSRTARLYHDRTDETAACRDGEAARGGDISASTA